MVGSRRWNRRHRGEGGGIAKLRGFGGVLSTEAQWQFQSDRQKGLFFAWVREESWKVIKVKQVKGIVVSRGIY